MTKQRMSHNQKTDQYTQHICKYKYYVESLLDQSCHHLLIQVRSIVLYNMDQEFQKLPKFIGIDNRRHPFQQKGT